MNTLTYMRLSDGTWTRLGECHARMVYVSRQEPDGDWSDPGAPLRRTYIVAVIEDEISTGAAHLRGVAYKIWPAPSQLSDGDRQRLQALHSQDKEEL